MFVSSHQCKCFYIYLNNFIKTSYDFKNINIENRKILFKSFIV